jgi:hypothetical protein
MNKAIKIISLVGKIAGIGCPFNSEPFSGHALNHAGFG